ncbi:MAG: hypothetical protein L0228_17205 [Planctomycetes bacterium]|nr:hypothetical protein [Planctomycetota bacterium]
MRKQLVTTSVVIALSLLGFNGCGKGPSDPAGGEHAGEEHAHADEGPHGGHIIELGTEEHHAELTHDDATHKVGIYLLGSDAKTAAPIEAESVTINVSADGVPSQYLLPSVPQDGEAAGQSSYFEIVSEPLCDVVAGESEANSTQARLSLSIGGKPYVGLIETTPHEHDHDHGHE